MKIAVSACLLGVPCRYDGRSKGNQDVIDAVAGHEIVRICPEVMAGLPIPHPANEQRMTEEGLRVVDCEGNDNTEAFLQGSARACAKAVEAGCKVAILKAKSPSCGVGQIYDGTFTGTLVEGDGTATTLLREAGITVLTEKDLDQLPI